MTSDRKCPPLETAMPNRLEDVTDHHSLALDCLGSADVGNAAAPALQLQAAQVHATLALVDAVERLRNDYAAFEILR